jgi:hypothetical protein
MKKDLSYRKNIGLLFACLAFLILGGCSLYENGGITYVSLVGSISKVIPGTIVLYCLGWLIGSMIEGSKLVKREKDLGYANALLEEIMKEEGIESLDELGKKDNSDEENSESVE